VDWGTWRATFVDLESAAGGKTAWHWSTWRATFVDLESAAGGDSLALEYLESDLR